MKYSLPKHILPLASLCLMALSCSDHAPDSYLADEGNEGEIRITLHIPVAASQPSTRAYPSGGADGDGREEGLDNENGVADANIFFFTGSGFNPATDPATIAVTGVYVADVSKFTSDSDADPFEKKITLKIKSSDTNLEEKGILTAREVSFVTVLNAGKDLSDTFKSLSDLRSFTDFDGAWSFSDGKYSKFLMTTAYDADNAGNITIGSATRKVGSNRLEKNVSQSGADKEVKWIGETTVQRICGRVDLMYLSANESEDAIIYSTDGGAKVYVKNILPVNFMSKTSYLLSKVTTGVPSKWTDSDLGSIVWGGVESTVAATGLPANYVIEPTTLGKAAGSTNLSVLSDWYGATAAFKVVNSIKTATNGLISNYSQCNINAAENDGYDKTLIIGYPNENIQSPHCYKSDFITGLIIRAQYRPARIVMKKNDDFVAVEVTDAVWNAMTDKTFWRYLPIAATDEISDTVALYFTSQADCEEYAAAHQSDLAEITCYSDGVCYYNLWLRHYNDLSYKTDDTAVKDSYPMEYSIVRNNIYRVSINFSGPGDPQPETREPDTMKSRIFVRKWNQRIENNPLQF